MEKLAVVAKILDLSPIKGSDFIEMATVLGWGVITQKNLYEVGDLAIIIFPDTLIPKKFIDEKYVGDEKVRLKTMKLRGHYSAGLLVPLSFIGSGYSEGDEVSTLLGVEKWVAAESSHIQGETIGKFPTMFVPKTDEPDIRSETEALLEVQNSPWFKNIEFVITLKYDGASCTYIAHDKNFRVCTRKFELKETANNTLWNLAKKYKVHEKLLAAGDNIAIQGEVCGPGIQKNPLKLKEVTFFVFLIKDLATNTWFTWDNLVEFCIKNDLPYVKELYRFYPEKEPISIARLQDFANRAKYDDGRADAEGIVLRPVTPVGSATMQKSWWSVKIMNQPYDMKKGKDDTETN